MTKISDQTIGHVVAEAEATDPSSNSPAKLWGNINWKRTEKHVRRLQERIYRATKNQQWRIVRNLQKLLARSYFNKIIAIHEVTEKNDGRITPGIDNKVYDTAEKRWEVSLETFDFRTYKPFPVRRVNIPKPDGTTRPLGIPTMDDRIMQSIIKTALEPEWEARFEPHSYGFRPGRSTMDAIAEIRSKLAWSKTNVWILDADISKCFDNIAHEPLLQQVPVFKPIIRRLLKAGSIEFGEFIKTEAGTPQGGIISPLLANIALHGLEHLFSISKPKGISLVRYADDFVVIASSRAILERYALPKVADFLSQQGLSINVVKTKIVHRSEGFNFLGFTIQYFKKRQGSILLVTPSKRNISQVSKNIKRVFRQILYRPVEEVIKRLNIIIRGWANYYQYVNAKRSFTHLRKRIYKIIWFGLKRLHPQKPAKWLLHKYIRLLRPQKWMLAKENQGLFDPIFVPLRKYIKVKDTSSPFDPSQKLYWKNRTSMKTAIR